MGLSHTAFQILKRSIKMDANNKTEVTEKTAEQTEAERKKASKPFSAPEITAVSYPKSSPPRMATEVIEYR